MARIFLFLIGIILVSISISFMIIYLNLLNMGYSFLEYVKFISMRVEVLIIFVGILLLYLTVFGKEKFK